MEKQTEFVEGLYLKKPREGAPDFVLYNGGIKIDDMLAMLNAEKAKGEEWLNFDVKLSKKGTTYCEVNRWKPENAAGGQPQEVAGNQMQPVQQAPQQAAEDEDMLNSVPF